MLLFFFDSMINFPHRNLKKKTTSIHPVAMTKCYDANQSDSEPHNLF